MEPRSGSEEGTRHGVQRSLALAFAFVICAFVAITVYSQIWISRIDEPATEIATNASPSIEALADARDDLGELRVTIAQELRADEDGEPYDLAAITEAQRRLDNDIAKYLRQLQFPGELELAGRIRRALVEVDEAVARIEDALRDQDLIEARRITAADLRRSVETASQAMHDTTSFNAKNAAELALGIEHTRRTSMTVSLALEAVAVFAALVAAFVVHRVVRMHAAVVESRNELSARRAEELDMFASRVAHDLLNPLQAIGFGLDIIRQKNVDPSIDTIVSKTASGARRAAAIVKDLLAFARASSPPEGERVALPEVVAGVIEGLADDAAKSGIVLATEPMPHAELACARGVLASILENLVRNALKYMRSDDDGIEREVTIRGRQRGDVVTIEVADTGIGIAPSSLQTIFLPHVRASGSARPGLGLGLATVKRLVEAHGGTVRARSTLGRGSVFAVDLPVARSPLEAKISSRASLR